VQLTDDGYAYEFGSGEDELARLEAQGGALAPATRMIFAAAGIQAGMRVLDLGCGAGDVTFVAASLAGPEGHVTGIDRSPDALARARLRAERPGTAGHAAGKPGTGMGGASVHQRRNPASAVLAYPMLLSAWGTTSQATCP
jgi:SAM-dependent methyltransferase